LKIAIISTFSLSAINDSEATLSYFTAEDEFALRWDSNHRKGKRLYLKIEEQRDSKKFVFPLMPSSCNESVKIGFEMGFVNYFQFLYMKNTICT